ncbi:MAG: class II glutamine amidotransferase [Pseudomonadota bacterium]
MCELFGLSAARPRAAARLLAEFRLRGGASADNPDGWGIAWRGPSGWHLEKAPVPAATSGRFATLARRVRSPLVIAHVRKARHPPVPSLVNAHPFVSACCGREWVFAHNGLVPEIVGLAYPDGGRVCRPLGDTDSEYAFCHLLGGIAREFQNAASAGSGAWFRVLGTVSELVASLGKFNFLLSDGEHLIAYGHDRLHWLEPGSGAGERRVVVATEPLGADAGWRAFAPGELRIYRGGTLMAQVSTRPSARPAEPAAPATPEPVADPTHPLAAPR